MATLEPRKLCAFFAAGGCSHGANCKFAHDFDTDIKSWSPFPEVGRVDEFLPGQKKEKVVLRRRRILVNRWRPPSPSSVWPPGLRAWPISEIGSALGSPSRLSPRGKSPEEEALGAESPEISPVAAEKNQAATTLLPRAVCVAGLASEDGNSASGEEEVGRQVTMCESKRTGNAILVPRRQTRVVAEPLDVLTEAARGVLELSAETGARFGCGREPLRLCSTWCIRPALCISGAACPWAHGVRELREIARKSCEVSRFLHTGFTPTRACGDFVAGYCGNGLRCSFAHGAQEIALIPQRSERPAPDKKAIRKVIRKRIGGRRWTKMRARTPSRSLELALGASGC